MPMILITCPSTNRPLAMGIVLGAAAFASTPIEGQFVHCPHCQMTHRWSTAEAYLAREA